MGSLDLKFPDSCLSVRARNSPGKLFREVRPGTGKSEDGLARITYKQKARAFSSGDQRQNLNLQVCRILKFVYENPREFRRNVAENFWTLLEQ